MSGPPPGHPAFDNPDAEIPPDLDDPPREPEAALPDPWPSFDPMPIEWLTEDPPEPRWLLRRLERPPGAAPFPGDGVFRASVPGILAGAGAAGKSSAAVELAMAVATGGDWLGSYRATKGRALVLLGEEDPVELRQRISRIARRLRLSPAQLAAVREGCICVPLAGRANLTLTEADTLTREVRTTEAARALVRRVRAGGYSLVVIDPLARFAGAEAESDNAAATRFVQVVEALLDDGKGPAVLILHHTSQQARVTKGLGTSGVRGVTGLTDGPRWVAMLEEDPDADGWFTFRVTKSNNAAKPSPVPLRHDPSGAGLIPGSRLEYDEARHRTLVARYIAAADKKAAEERAKAEAEGRSAGPGASPRSAPPALALVADDDLGF